MAAMSVAALIAFPRSDLARLITASIVPLRQPRRGRRLARGWGRD